MSYYNYLFIPTLPDIDAKTLTEDNSLVFYEKEDGFSQLIDLIGEQFIRNDEDSGSKYVLLEEVIGGTDGIRPRDLLWNLNRERDVKYGDPDCAILVSEMKNHIDWSSVDDVKYMEDGLAIYEQAVEKHGDKLLIYPL